MLTIAEIAAGQTVKTRISVDETLIGRIADGDRDAFCALYEQTRCVIYAFALSILKHPEDAEDAAQETFLAVRASAGSYTPGGKPLAWMFTIAKNICYMNLRQRGRTAEFTENDDADLLTDRIGNAEDRAALEAALRILSENEAKIILLHAVSGYRHREIAQLLGLPLSTVLSKYNRGIKKLRQALEGDA